MGSSNDIDARNYFGQVDFFMPELLLKELCIPNKHININHTRIQRGIQGDQLYMALCFWYLVIYERYCTTLVYISVTFYKVPE